MNTLQSYSTPLPLLISLPLALMFAAMLLLQIRASRVTAVQFLIFAIGLRLLLSAFFSVTFKPSPLGMSWNALGTIMITALGFTVIKRQKLLDIALLPVYAVVLVIALSGVVNWEIPGTIEVIAKYGYFIVIMLSLSDALEEVDPDRIFGTLLGPMLIPFVFQIASVFLGIAKAGESDGSASYIGGFNHEAGFSVTLSIGLLLLLFIQRMHPLMKAGLLGWYVMAVFLANYRTTIVAMLPLIGVMIFSGTIRRVPQANRGLVGAIMGLTLVAASVLVGFLMKDRYGDIGTVVQENFALIKPPSEFTPADKDLLSSRIYIWSSYIYGYLEGTPVQHILGMGAEEWADHFVVYAHNTLVSALYDTGLLGVLTTLWLWAGMLILAFNARTGPRLRVIMGHISFIILSMATMPLWGIEGLIFYGILCGYSLHLARAPTSRPISKSLVPGASNASEHVFNDPPIGALGPFGGVGRGA